MLHDTVLRRNRRWVRHIRLEYDDLYQNLALCLILSVEEYDSSFGPLRPYFTGSSRRSCGKTKKNPERNRRNIVTAKVLVSTENLPYEDWLEYRKAGIGGSDAAVVCGISRYKSPVELWMEKTGQLPAQETGGSGLLGQPVGSPGAGGVHQAHGDSRDKPSALYQSEEHPFMLANVDGLCQDPVHGPCIFEAKTASAYKTGEWEDAIPDEYMIQIQHYMAVTGCQGAYIAVLIGGNAFRWRFVERDEELIAMLISLEEEFLASCAKGYAPGPGWFQRFRQVPCRTVPQQRSPV